MKTDEQDEKITLAVLLGGIWPRNPFMTELTKKKTDDVARFMD